VSDVTPEQLGDVLKAVAERLRDETGPELMTTLWTATAILIGLRYPREQVGEMMEGVATMVLGIRGIEESWVYQDIFAKGLAEGEAKGLVEGEREALLRLGRRRFGAPGAEVEARIAALGDLDGLRELLDRVMDVTTWDELMTSLDAREGRSPTSIN
jgi:predicted transposase YdaD